MAKKRASGSNLGLIITLVFFVLSTVILGVTTYMGAEDQDKKTKEKDEAVKKAGVAENDKNWYRTQARIYRAYMGTPAVSGADADAVAQEKQQLMAGTLPSMNGQKDATEVKDYIGKLDGPMGWTAGNAPAKNFESRLNDMATEVGAIKTKLANAEKKAKEAEDARVNAEENAKAEVEKTNEAMKRLRADIQKELEKDFYTKAVAEVRKQLEAESKIMADLRNRLAKETEVREKAEKDLKRMTTNYEKELVTLRQTRKDLDDTKVLLSALAEKSGEDLSRLREGVQDQVATRKFRDWDKDWQIVTLSAKGDMPYINLGSADGLLPQVSFSIHGATGVPGRKLSEVPKGTLEVVRVIGPHLSQARVTSVADRFKNPILKGDLLYNGSWDPNRRKQIAVAGLVDLGRDGGDSIEELKRLLARQKVDVVAYIDSRDEKEPSIKTVGEGLGKDTEYLILADRMKNSKNPKAKTEFGTKYDAKRDEMIKKAEDTGITKISLTKYLEMIGYRAPTLSGGSDR